MLWLVALGGLALLRILLSSLVQRRPAPLPTQHAVLPAPLVSSPACPSPSRVRLPLCSAALCVTAHLADPPAPVPAGRP